MSKQLALPSYASRLRKTCPRQHSFVFAVIVIVCCCAPRHGFAQSLHELIDREIEKHAGGALSPQADDEEFLRRVYLDFSGKPPDTDKVREFLADDNSDKREKLINELLGGTDFPRHMQEVFSAMLLERRTDTVVPDPEWEQYLRQSFSTNKSWEQLVGELLFSEPDENKQPKPQAKFFLAAGRANIHQKTQDISRIFLGRDVMCAQCHNHPTINDYVQRDYFGLFSYLQDTPEKANSEFESVFSPGKQTTGPKLPGGEEVTIPEFAEGEDEQAKLYRPQLLLSLDLPHDDNRSFVRNSVNRFWFLLMGRGLVHPLYLHHSDNPPSHPELMDAIANEFANSSFDVKYLLREIALSNAYQRSGRLPQNTESKDVPPQSYRTAIRKPLSPEQMAWSVMQVTGNLTALLKAPTPTPETTVFTYKDYINGRVEQVPENVADVMKLFVGVFGNPPGEPEIVFSPAMGHALFLMNEQLILDWLKPKPGNLVDRLLQLSDNVQIGEELYLSVLTRSPTKEEQLEIADYLELHKNRRGDALGELAWALIASSEFRSN